MAQQHRDTGVEVVVVQPPPRSKDKLVFFMLSMFLGFAGIDRLYVGCTYSGMAKMLLLTVLSVLAPGAVWELLFSEEKPDKSKGAWSQASVTLLLLMVYGLWVLVDTVLVFVNALIGSRSMPLSYDNGTGMNWGDGYGLRGAQVVAGVMLLVAVLPALFLAAAFWPAK